MELSFPHPVAVDHYENFPVASVLLPPRLRRPVALIYRFARESDDFADEGDLPDRSACVGGGGIKEYHGVTCL
jgi:phytoene/squalene synthetase